MKHTIIVKISFFIVFILGVFLSDGFSGEVSAEKISAPIPFENTSFYTIFLNNLLMGIILVFVGYLTFSIGTYILVFWNGIFLGFLLNDALMLKIQTSTILNLVLYHGVIEVYAIIIFSEIGYKGGISFFKAIFLNEEDIYVPQKLDILYPILLLFIASIVEGVIIT